MTPNSSLGSPHSAYSSFMQELRIASHPFTILEPEAIDIAEPSNTFVETQTCVIHERRPRRSNPIRWWICGLLFASTVINYLDRQLLALLAQASKRPFTR